MLSMSDSIVHVGGAGVVDIEVVCTRVIDCAGTVIGVVYARRWRCRPRVRCGYRGRVHCVIDLVGVSTSCTVVFSTSPALAFDVWHY